MTVLSDFLGGSTYYYGLIRIQMSPKAADILEKELSDFDKNSTSYKINEDHEIKIQICQHYIGSILVPIWWIDREVYGPVKRVPNACLD